MSTKTLITITTLATAAVIGVLVFLWQTGRFGPSPAAILQDSFAKANEGQYEAATQNLILDHRIQLTSDPDHMNWVWNVLTKNKSVSEVRVIEELTEEGSVAVSFEVKYKDGATVFAVEYFAREDGVWKHTMNGLFKKMVAALPPEQVLPHQPPKHFPFPEELKNIKLEDEYDRLFHTDVLLRFPVGSQWNPTAQMVEHPELGLSFTVKSTPGLSSKETVAKVEEMWKGLKYKLSIKKEVELGQCKGVLFEGTTHGPHGFWGSVMALVLGNDKNSSMIMVLGAKGDIGVDLVRECLMSAQWDENLFSDSLEDLPYTLQPTKGLNLVRTLPLDQTAYFSESGSAQFQKPGEAYLNIAVMHFEEAPEDRKAMLEEMSKAASDIFTPPKIESVQPISVNSLAGYESVATTSITGHNLDLLRYTAILFKSDTEVYCFEAMVNLSNRKTFEPQFKQMVRSFKLK